MKGHTESEKPKAWSKTHLVKHKKSSMQMRLLKQKNLFSQIIDLIKGVFGMSAGSMNQVRECKCYNHSNHQTIRQDLGRRC